MEVTLHLMKIEEKVLLARLMELYLYEFSQFSLEDVNEYGCYGYRHIDDYWNEEGRFPYLIRVDGKIAGFALICPHCDYRKEEDARCIGEFFVLLKYRRKGVGKKAAVQLFDRHRGRWEVCCWKNNLPACRFWQKVVEEYTGGRYQICGRKDSRNEGFIFENEAAYGAFSR